MRSDAVRPLRKAVSVHMGVGVGMASLIADGMREPTGLENIALRLSVIVLALGKSEIKYANMLDRMWPANVPSAEAGCAIPCTSTIAPL